MASIDDAYDGAPRTWQEAFPPICLRTHYDPCAMSSYILPPAGRPVPDFDPRPAVRICTSYYSMTRGDSAPATIQTAPPKIPAAFCGAKLSESIEFPVPVPGGFDANIESSLTGKTEPLTKCSEKRYISNTIVNAPRSDIVGFAAAAYAPYEPPANPSLCAQQDLDAAAARSAQPFLNHTRTQRVGGGL